MVEKKGGGETQGRNKNAITDLEQRKGGTKKCWPQRDQKLEETSQAEWGLAV